MNIILNEEGRSEIFKLTSRRQYTCNISRFNECLVMEVMYLINIAVSEKVQVWESV